MKKPAKRSSAPLPMRWVWLTVGIGAAVLTLAALLNPKSSAPPEGVQNPKLTISAADQERALRAEQLQAAERLVDTFPQSDDALYLLGLVHNEQGDSATAVKHWERSLELDATRADANDSLGYAFLLRDEYEKAETHFRKAPAIDPTLATANFRLANTFVHQGKMPEAAAILEKANSLSAEGHRLLGQAYQHLKEYAKARASYEVSKPALISFTPTAVREIVTSSRPSPLGWPFSIAMATEM